MKSMVELVIEQDTLVVSCIQLEDKLHRLKTEQMRNNHEYNRLQEEARVAEVYYPPVSHFFFNMKWFRWSLGKRRMRPPI